MRYLSFVAGLPIPSFEKSTSIKEWSAHIHYYVNSKVDSEKEIHYWQSLPWDNVGSLVDYDDGIENNKSSDSSLYGTGKSVIRVVF